MKSNAIGIDKPTTKISFIMGFCNHFSQVGGDNQAAILN